MSFEGSQTKIVVQKKDKFVGLSIVLSASANHGVGDSGVLFFQCITVWNFQPVFPVGSISANSHQFSFDRFLEQNRLHLFRKKMKTSILSFVVLVSAICVLETSGQSFAIPAVPAYAQLGCCRSVFPG